MYFNQMTPHDLYVTGKQRFEDRFEDTKVEYNGDELYDDIFNMVHQALKNNEFNSSDITNAVIKKIQPKIELLNRQEG